MSTSDVFVPSGINGNISVSFGGVDGSLMFCFDCFVRGGGGGGDGGGGIILVFGLAAFSVTCGRLTDGDKLFIELFACIAGGMACACRCC